MKNKFIVMAIILSVMLTGCAMDSTGSSYVEHVYVDEDTGVNYIWINSSSGVALSPRYNADGTLYISK